MNAVIVTGANGFVGSNIVTVFSKLGWHVYAVDLQFDNPIAHRWDASQVELIESTCAQLPPLSANALIHGAFITASPESRDETPEDNLRANINPMLQMMEYAERHDIQRSIYLSSSGVYRSMPDKVIDETYLANPLGVYAVAKTFMENTVDTLRTALKRDITCARLGNIYGMNEFQRPTRPFLSVIGQMIHMATTTGEIIVTRPDEVREWTLASDIGYALDSLLNTETLNYSLYNVASMERHSNHSIAYLIRDVINHVKITVDRSADHQKPLTRLGTLDNSRLHEDTGFNNWTALNQGITEPILVGMMRSKADA